MSRFYSDELNADQSETFAEVCLLGALLCGVQAYQVLRRIEPEYFAHPLRRRVYEAVKAHDATGRPMELLDLHGVYHELHGQAVDTRLLLDLCEGRAEPNGDPFPFSSAAVETYADAITRNARRRGVQTVMGEGSERARDPSSDPGEIARGSVAALETLFLEPGTVGRSSIAEGLTEAADGLLDDRTHSGYSLGFPDLDRIIGPSVQPGSLVMVGGRPGMGKSMFATNMALRVSKSNRSALLVSLEVGKHRIQENVLLAESAMSREAVRQHPQHLTPAIYQVEELRDRLQIVDAANMTPATLRALVAEYQRHFECRLVVVDYLQLMKPDEKTVNRQEAVAAISRDLKALAMELGLVIVALSQLKRESEQRTDARPRMSDLRESGALEQDADVILLLYRPAYYNKDRPPNPRRDRCEVMIEKNRNGATGMVPFGMDLAASRFFDDDVPSAEERHDPFDRPVQRADLD